MKKKVFLNLLMGISLIATPALLLVSCGAQASDVVDDVKLPITVKDINDIITVHEVKYSTIALTTVQKLFNVEASDFENVNVSLKNGYVEAGETNQVILTAKNGYVFENGKSLESIEFTLSKTTLPITAKSTDDGIYVEEVSVSPITFTTVQKVFNITEGDFENVTAIFKNPVDSITNQIVLTAKDDFIFEGGISVINSAAFNLLIMLPTTVKNAEEAALLVSSTEISASPITLATVQKLFNIVQADFENVIASLTEIVKPGTGNQIILTAKDGFVFKNGTNTLESLWFIVQGA